MGVGIALGRLTFLQKPRTQLLGQDIILDEDRGFSVSKNLSRGLMRNQCPDPQANGSSHAAHQQASEFLHLKMATTTNP